jgi:hypothetical protein
MCSHNLEIIAVIIEILQSTPAHPLDSPVNILLHIFAIFTCVCLCILVCIHI